MIVVYLLIPTSNHNDACSMYLAQALFISWFLHQTTTQPIPHHRQPSCLSLDSYIKPQRRVVSSMSCPSCLSLDSYIKPQLLSALMMVALCCLSLDSYIKPQRDVSTTLQTHSCLSLDSYIKPQPHGWRSQSAYCCLSLDSYIKPQLPKVTPFLRIVVYLLIPTSNHNLRFGLAQKDPLFISWFLHQTTT